MKKQQQETRYIFVRDDQKTVTGIASYEEAQRIKESIPETETQRVRCRMRNRTGLWDVVVKVRQEAKEAAPLTPEQRAAAEHAGNPNNT